MRAALRERVEGCTGVGAVLGDDRRARWPGLASGGGGERDVRQIGATGEVRVVASRERVKRRVAVGGERQDGERTRLRRGGGGARGGLLHDHRGVDPADTKAVHHRAARVTQRGPRERGLGVLKRQRRRDGRVERGEVEVRGHRRLADAQHRLHQPGDPRRDLQVADVRLHRAHANGRAVAARLAEHGGERVDLDRVAHRRSGAMGLDRVDGARIDLRVGHRGAEQSDLRVGVGRHQVVRQSVVVAGRPAQHGVDAVAVRDRVGQPAQDDHATALGAHVAVGRRVERLAAAVRRQHSELLHHQAVLGAVDDAHPARGRHVALAVLDGAHRLVHRDQAGAARGVHVDARAFKTEHGADAARAERRVVARSDVAIAARRADLHAVVEPHQVLALRRAQEHADHVVWAELERREVRVLERLVYDLQRQPLLGVERASLTRRHTEERVVEHTNAGEPAAVCGVVGQRLAVVEAAQRVQVPSARGHRADGLPAVQEQLPELGDVLSAREADAHPDDRDRLVLGRHPHTSERSGRRLIVP